MAEDLITATEFKHRQLPVRDDVIEPVKRTIIKAVNDADPDAGSIKVRFNVLRMKEERLIEAWISGKGWTPIFSKNSTHTEVTLIPR